MALDGSITYVSPSVERVRGLTPAEAAAQSVREASPPESAAVINEYFEVLDAAIAAGTELPRFNGELEYYRKDGSILLGETQVIPHVDQDGRVVQILGVTRDISERRQFEEQLNMLAVTDPLTGVWNRRHGEELFTADLTDAQRHGFPMSLLVLDIDYFKTINDTHGHQVGDRVLIEFCRRLTNDLRATDTLVRWDGDEFVIVLRHCGLAESLLLADRIRSLVSRAPFGEVGQLTVSIGAAELLPSDDLDSWFNRADKAAYRAKSRGRDAVQDAE